MIHSFVSFGFLTVEFGKDYQTYRVIMDLYD